MTQNAKSKTRVGYCTNVHAGADLPSAKSNLLRYACRVKELLELDRPLGIGLWLAEEAANQAIESNGVEELRSWLLEHGLQVFTMNGFPQGNFHQPQVKHRVYHPAWWEPSRLEYTRQLVRILDGLLDREEVGSISTLPIGWGMPTPSDAQLALAANHLKQLARELHSLRERTGREIVLAIEPEPGCYLGDSKSLRGFFDQYLVGGADDAWVRRHLTICHDVCHAAVMCEDQRAELKAYRDSGLRIGKVQVSSAIQVDWDRLDLEHRKKAYEHLRSFAEDRYLHQTSIRIEGTDGLELVEDLPILLARSDKPSELRGSWRVHFHVPIYAQSLGALESTQGDILDCMQILNEADSEEQSLFAESFFTGHWEVETYAWSVLPSQFAPSDLADGIAKEMGWFLERANRLRSGGS